MTILRLPGRITANGQLEVELPEGLVDTTMLVDLLRHYPNAESWYRRLLDRCCGVSLASSTVYPQSQAFHTFARQSCETTLLRERRGNARPCHQKSVRRH
jgi:hypothetical protein